MNPIVLSELETSRKRLDYYLQLKEKSAASAAGSRRSAKPGPVDKWIEIYSERVQKLERQVNRMQRLGLKTQLNGERGSSAAAR